MLKNDKINKDIFSYSFDRLFAILVVALFLSLTNMQTANAQEITLDDIEGYDGEYEVEDDYFEQNNVRSSIDDPSLDFSFTRNKSKKSKDSDDENINFFHASSGLNIFRKTRTIDGMETGTLKSDRDTDALFFIAMGRKFNDRVLIEIETGYRDINLKLNNSGTITNANQETYSLMLNGYYKFVPDFFISPYMTSGVGIMLHTFDGRVGGENDRQSHDKGLAYQLGVGTIIDVSKNIAFNFDYRYSSSADLKFKNLDINFSSHEIRGGLFYNF